MKIPKALEILHNLLYHPENHHDLDTQNTIALGIEALKEIARARRIGQPFEGYQLPGEDPE